MIAASAAGIAPELKSWCINKALPFWADKGVDRARGGFHERLFHDGTPDHAAIRRLRVQARQIYVYAHAAHAGWYADGANVALNGFDYLMAKGRAPDGAPGFVHLLKPDGSVENHLRDTYDHMFVVLATAWLARVSGDAQVRAVLDETMAFIDNALTDKAGTLLEGKPASLPRRQNPNMHAFEAMMALHETLSYPGALQRAEKILTLMRASFVDPETGALREFFNDDWSPRPSPEGDSVEPGHMAEWTWLLRRYASMGGAIPHDLPDNFLLGALKTQDQSTGLLFDEADRFGTIRKFTARSWPQTELAKAWLAQTEAGIDGARGEAEKALRQLRHYYLSGVVDGGWIDQRGSDGKILSIHMPSSTFYHIFVCIHEADRVLNQNAA